MSRDGSDPEAKEATASISWHLRVQQHTAAGDHECKAADEDANPWHTCQRNEEQENLHPREDREHGHEPTPMLPKRNPLVTVARLLQGRHGLTKKVRRGWPGA